MGTLTEFISYFQRRFSRVEAVDEARTQVERTLGQTQDLEHHWHTFCRYLDLLPQAVPGTPNRTVVLTCSTGTGRCHQAYLTASQGTTRSASSRWISTPGVLSRLCRQSILWCKPENKALADAAARAFDSKGNRLTQHWIDFPGRVLQGATKAQQRQLIGAAEYAEQPLTVQTARSLLAPMIDSAVSKSEGRLDAKYSTRIDLLETSVGSLETTVTSELRSFKAEMKEVLQGATAGPQHRYQQQQSKGKGGWQRRSAMARDGYGNSSAAAPAPAPYGQTWAKKPWPVGGVVALTWRGTARTS